MRIVTTATRGAARTAARGTALGALVIGLLCVPTAAQAGQADGNSDPSGYTASVSIHFYGSGVPGGDIHRSVTVHPSCWWAPAAGPAGDAKAMLAWYDEVTQGATDNLTLSLYGPRSVWEEAAAKEAAGGDITWYKAYCKDPADYTKFGIDGTDNGVDPIPGQAPTWITYLYHPYNAGDAIPAPRVSPEELARAAREVMEIPEPVTNHNPKVNAPGAPTLVGLPTWFWVTEPKAVGNAEGALDVTADLQQPDGLVWAKVVAKTDGLSIASSSGSALCPPKQALVKYANGASDANACTVVFTHASPSLAVTTRTDWSAVWTGSGGTGGDLDPLQRGLTIPIAVAEVQNIVTR
jgi:hypothetical protein